MKAILVIDIPNDFNMKGAFSDCVVYEGGKHRMWNRIAHIKPLPLKKTDFEDMMFSRNDCIDEILEEKEKII